MRITRFFSGCIVIVAAIVLIGCVDTVSDAKEDSGNAFLSMLTVDAGTLSPAFSALTTEYELNVSNSVEKVTVAATAADSGAKVSVSPTQPTALAAGTTTAVSVLVTAANGSTKTYTVRITRGVANAANANLSSLSVDCGSFDTAFNPDTVEYSVTVAPRVPSITVTAVAADSGATVAITPAQPVSLKVGSNAVTVTVTAKNKTVKTYTLNVNRPAPQPPVDLTNYRLVAAGDDGFKVLDVTNPGLPSVKGSCLTGTSYNSAKAVATDGYYAYVGDTNDGFEVIDISKLSAPTVVSKLAKDLSQISSIVVVGDYAYVCRQYMNTVTVINVSNPVKPAVEKTLGSLASSTEFVTTDGSYLYVASVDGMRVLNLADPKNPAVVGTWASTRCASEIALSGHYAYIAASQQGVAVVDISDPSKPVQVGSYAVSGQADTIKLKGNFAYVTGYDLPFTVLDVSNPASPALVSQYSGSTSGSAILAVGDYAYFYTGSLVDVLDLTKPAAPRAFRRNAAVTGGYGAVSGNYAYVGQGTQGIVVVDVSEPDYPTVTTKVPVSDNAKNVVMDGSTLYVYRTVGTAQYIDTFDVSNPKAPVKNDSISAAATVNALAVANNTLYLCEYNKLEIYDLAGKKLITQSLGITSPYSVAVSGTVAYFGNYSSSTPSDSGLVIVDVSNPAVPTKKGSCALGWTPDSIAISGTYAYAVNYTKGLFGVIDVSDATAPKLIKTSTEAKDPQKVLVSGSTVWVENYRFGLLAFDISTPSNPVLRGTYTPPVNSGVSDFALTDTRAYLFDVYNRMVVVDITDPTKMHNMLSIKGYY